ncbi:MAG: HAD family hydrolase [Chloroflexi bacterium]|nr:HAD family hydrolase [Chloroflexota bacterium]
MWTVFLDRDGVINENRPDHVKSWTEFEFLPGAPEAIARLSDAGCRVFVITNQAIINRGIVPRDVVEGINARMVEELRSYGASVTDVAYCPHRPEEACPCRKPRPGLLTALAATHSIDLASAVLIGDAFADIEAGRAAGCTRTVLVLTGRGRHQLPLIRERASTPVTVTNDLGAAVDLLLRQPVGRS